MTAMKWMMNEGTIRFAITDNQDEGRGKGQGDSFLFKKAKVYKEKGENCTGRGGLSIIVN